MGPIVHAELVFVKNGRCKALQLFMKCVDGYPRLEHDKNYETSANVFQYHWARLTFPPNQANDLENDIELLCEKIVNEQQFQMNDTEMIACALPMELRDYCRRLMESVFHLTYSVKPKEGCKQTHCIGLIAHILKEAGKYADVPLHSTASELLHYLVETRKCKLTDRPFVQFTNTGKMYKVRDGANIKRSMYTLNKHINMVGDHDDMGDEESGRVLEERTKAYDAYIG